MSIDTGTHYIQYWRDSQVEPTWDFGLGLSGNKWLHFEPS